MGPGSARALDAWTAGRPVIPYDPQVERVWGELAERHVDGCVLPAQKVPLVTFNTADFGDVATYHGLALLSEQI